ncbi:MAG: hypothetical protein GF311_03000 [Candidatus Lokiarchaeota archaeon]|nr:hypothetical protein [Candidatus Lokiarchaeota archaeon]
MQESPEEPYLDYYFDSESDLTAQFEVDSEVVVHSNQKIRMNVELNSPYPEKTIFRFVIPYGWEPISLQKKFCTIDSSIDGYIRETGSQLMLEYILKESSGKGSYITFSYNSTQEKSTAGDIAYYDAVYCAIDVKRPDEKIFRRIAKQEIKIKPGKTEFFLVKLPMVFSNNPVDLEIVALDKYGNRDIYFNETLQLDCEPSLECPNTAKLEEGHAKIERAVKFKNVQIAKKTSNRKLFKENLGYDAFPEFKELHKNIGKIYIKYKNIKAVSNPIIRDRDIKSQLYWGDIHIHTREFSDGMGTGNDAYHYAKNYSLLDFAAIADHVNQRYNDWMEGRKNINLPFSRKVWENIVNLAKIWSDETFQAIPAYEWSGRIAYVNMLRNSNLGYDAVSDKIIYFPLESAEDAPLVDYISEDGCFQHQLYQRLANFPCEIVSHTPMSYPMGTYWKEVDNRKEKVVEIYSMHGSSEKYGDGYRPLINHRKTGSVQWALAYGLKLGFVAGGDDHYTHPGCPIRQYKMRNLDTILRYRPGITGIFADQLDSKSLLNSMHKRNCYATTGERMWIKLKIEDALMGQEIKIEQEPIINVTVCGTNKIECVELIKNGSVICVRVPEFDRITFATKDENLGIGHKAYYYVRVTQFDGERGWSSPVWVERVQ